MTDDVRELLGRAFGDEPPLRIDRDEVLEQGRKRLRRRRFFEAGSVVAAVVVAAVGAATLTNLGGAEPERMPPAASSAQPAPNEGPSLPLPPATTPPSVDPPASTRSEEGGRPPDVDLSKELTAVLYSSGIVTADDVEVQSRESGAMPVFQQDGDQYVYEADLVRPEVRGALQVTVDYVSEQVADCGMIPRPYTGCEEWDKGTSAYLARYEGSDGERRTYAIAVQPGGVRVSVTATNTTVQADGDGSALNPKLAPVLSDEELFILVTKVSFGV
jgi:hypothetical protein